MKEKCGLFAAFSNSKTDVIPLVTIGLRGLQHRGQEAWGVATSTMNPFKQKTQKMTNRNKIILFKKNIYHSYGRVSVIFFNFYAQAHLDPF